MDWYSYFTERFGWGNPYASVTQCQQMVTELIQNPHIPFRVSSAASVDFLAALADFAGDGCAVATTYTNAMETLVDELQRMRDLTEARDASWLEEGQEGGCGPLYTPGDYVVRDNDLDGDDLPDEEPEPDEPDLATLEELYGVNGEPGTTGTRRPFPDWQRCDKWTQADWLNLHTYRDKVLAPVGQSFDYLRPALDTLAAIELHSHRLTLPRQVELSMMASDLVDGMVYALEANLQALCSKSLYTGEGRRLVQKQLVSATSGQAQDNPD